MNVRPSQLTGTSPIHARYPSPGSFPALLLRSKRQADNQFHPSAHPARFGVAAQPAMRSQTPEPRQAAAAQPQRWQQPLTPLCHLLACSDFITIPFHLVTVPWQCREWLCMGVRLKCERAGGCGTGRQMCVCVKHGMGKIHSFRSRNIGQWTCRATTGFEAHHSVGASNALLLPESLR